MESINKNFNNAHLDDKNSNYPTADTQSNTYSEEDKELPACERSLLQKIVRTGLITSKHDIEIQRRDPKSPLFSIKSFELLKLHPHLLKGVYEMGYNAPSKIQETALPLLLANPPQNLIAQSQSGTGKTAAFVLAMLSRVDPEFQYPQVVCLSPTYELAIQTGEVAAKMSTYCPNIRLRYAVRGEDVEKGSKIEEQIIVGTPGKVLDWATKYKFFDPKNIKVFVLDEADIMVDTQGHQDQSFRIRKLLPETCQMMFFSATYTEDVMRFANAIAPMSVIIRLKREEETLDNIRQYYVNCNNKEDKYNALVNIYGGVTIGQAMIFCQTKKMALWLVSQMVEQGHAVALLSGELTVQQRISVLDRFREGKEKVLVTTNVLSRGIDIEQVTIVINFDLPMTVTRDPDYDTYLHRIGRTGRFGKKAEINLDKGGRHMEVEGKENRSVFISNLDFAVTELEVKDALSSVGHCEVLLVRDFKGRSKGFGYVLFEKPEMVAEALKKDRESVNNRPMFVSKCQPDKQSRSSGLRFPTELEKNKLFVKGLPSTCTKTDIENIFKPYGALKDVRVVTFRNGYSKGLAYVDFEDEVSAAQALLKTDNTVIKDRTISVALSQPPERRDPSEIKSYPPVVKFKSQAPPLLLGRRTKLSFTPSVLQKKSAQTAPTSADDITPLNNEDFRKMLLGSK
ncbi:unnamed protein product [Macrosiphum euphorbiae]|uniref:RNA helicase n=1 Tax=Macrosiphum euphorbiae TaxID=13131 RepID=A0AAV0W8E3_9HEMI|nr:unnamed protein product [Macrosiphum euphorbiae]